MLTEPEQASHGTEIVGRPRLLVTHAPAGMPVVIEPSKDPLANHPKYEKACPWPLNVCPLWKPKRIRDSVSLGLCD